MVPKHSGHPAGLQYVPYRDLPLCSGFDGFGAQVEVQKGWATVGAPIVAHILVPCVCVYIYIDS